MRSPSTLVRRAFVLSSHDLNRRIVSGAGYKFLGIGLRTFITIGSTATLARLLSPSDFGYVAMATVITEFAALFGAFGFANVLIQRRVINRLQLDTVFWAALAVGAVLTLVVFVLSYFAGWLFTDPKVGSLLRVLCLTFVLNSLVTVPNAVLSRLLRFRTEFWAQICAVVAGTVAAVSCAYGGLGVWSLVIGALAGALAAVVAAFACVPYGPRLRFNLQLLTSTWRTSGSYFGSGMLYYLNMNLDLLLIGRQLGAAPLGFYQNARSLTDEIRGRIAIPIQHVLFPAFSAIQTDRERFQQLFTRAASLLAAVVIPVGFGVSANAAELVLVLYGEQWRPMIPVMTMFGLSAAIRAATAAGSPLFSACNRVGVLLWYSLVGTALMVGGVILAMPHGIDAVAATVMATSLYSLVSFHAALRLIGLRLRHIGQIIGPPTLAALVMWAATAGLREFGGGWSTHPGVLLPLHVAAGAAVYLVTLHLISQSYLREFRQAANSILKRPLISSNPKL